MTYPIPVIAAAKGFEGLPLEPGADILLAKTADAFVRGLDDALLNPMHFRKAYTASAETVRRKFDWAELE